MVRVKCSRIAHYLPLLCYYYIASTGSIFYGHFIAHYSMQISACDAPLIVPAVPSNLCVVHLQVRIYYKKRERSPAKAIVLITLIDLLDLLIDHSLIDPLLIVLVPQSQVITCNGHTKSATDERYGQLTRPRRGAQHRVVEMSSPGTMTYVCPRWELWLCYCYNICGETVVGRV